MGSKTKIISRKVEIKMKSKRKVIIVGVVAVIFLVVFIVDAMRNSKKNYGDSVESDKEVIDTVIDESELGVSGGAISEEQPAELTEQPVEDPVVAEPSDAPEAKEDPNFDIDNLDLPDDSSFEENTEGDAPLPKN